MPQPTLEQMDSLKKLFTYHPPKGDQAQRYELMREQAKNLALSFATACPPSRELSLAITHLQTAVMFANAAIAINE